MKRLVLFLSLLLSLGMIKQAHAQYDIDALRFSYLGFGGTARSMATGGAFGAPGADFSVLSTNPAGIGLYKSSEISISPSFYGISAESSFYNENNKDIKYSFNLPGAGMILNLENSNGRWKNVQFGFGYNKLQSFHRNTSIEGFNYENSLLTEYRDRANDIGGLEFYDTELANAANLMPYDSASGEYWIDAPYGGVNQRKTIEERGAINEMTFSFGGNFEDKLYAGMTIGIPIIRYEMSSRHAETDIKDSIDMFQSFSLDEKLRTTGSGVNFKFGILYRPADWVRLGGAFHTPTFYSLHEEYSRLMTSYFDNSDFNEEALAEGQFHYELMTPMKALGDIAFIIGDYGLISAEYEYVDYSTARLSDENDISTPSNYDFKDDNDAITEKYTQAHNIKVGAEANLNPIQIRAGYALFSSPFQDNLNDGARTYYTFGIGLKQKYYYVDFAYVMETYEEDYYLYSPEYVNAAHNQYLSNRFVITLGLKL
ncbi:MAG: hypothetical protein R6T91_06595 [Bacteroidales bacterium]